MDREVRNMKGRLITWAGALGAVGCAIQVLKHLPFVSVLFMHNVPWSDGTTETVYVDYSPAVLTWAVLLGAAFLCLGRSEHHRVRRMSKVGVAACMVLAVPIVVSLAFGFSAMLRFYEGLSHAANPAALLPAVGPDVLGNALLAVAIWELAELMPSRIRCVGYAGVLVLAITSGLMPAVNFLAGLVPSLAGQVGTLCQWMVMLAFSVLGVVFALLARHGLETSVGLGTMPFRRKLLVAIVVFIPVVVLECLAFHRSKDDAAAEILDPLFQDESAEGTATVL